MIDTPGVREIGTGPVDRDLLGAGLPGDRAALRDCRFRDCRHDTEPGCAVRAAVESGGVSAARLASFHRLLDEVDTRAQG